MAGKPKQMAEVALLEFSEAGEEALRMVGDGELLTTIASKVGVGRAALAQWLSAPERAAEVSRARASGAAILVEEAKRIADCELPIIDPETFEPIHDVARDKLRIHTRHWIAERADRATWGQQQAAVTINLNGLHLDALRSRAAPQADVIDIRPVDN